MKLKSIQEKLNNIGYVTQIHNSIDSLILALPDKDGNPEMGTNSRVEEQNDKMIYIYYSGQVPIEEEYTNEKDLIDNIKKKFPIIK